MEVEDEARSLRLRPGSLRALEGAWAGGRDQGVGGGGLSEVETLYNLGRMHKQQGRPEEARVLWERGLEVDPRHVATLNNLGRLHDAQGRPEEARLLRDLL